MDKKQTSPELLQAEPLPTQEEPVPANPPSRKRQIDSGTDDKPQIKRARLTRKNLARFNKMGKDKKESRKSSSQRDSTSGSQKTKTTSTTSSGFALQAHKNGILDPIGSKPPANLKDLHRQHSRSRATVSPTESEYRGYARKVSRIPNEATMVVDTTRHMLKEYGDEAYHQSFNRSFTGFPDDVGFNDGLSAPQPDLVEGLEMEEYDPFPVDEKVDGAVLYKDNPRSMTLPHLAGEWKGLGKNMEAARLQSSYDGAALVYARNQALSYMGKSDPPGYAGVTTFTTDGTIVNHYAHYAEETEDGKTKYHQYQYTSTNVKDSYQGHKDGRRGLRNAQDHARNQSYALRDDLREYWKQHRNKIPPVAEDTSLPVLDSQANPYEETTPYQQASYEADTQEATQYDEEDDDEVVDQSCSKHRSSLKRSSSMHSSSKSSHQASSSNGHKRKASQPYPFGSEHASKHKSY